MSLSLDMLVGTPVPALADSGFRNAILFGKRRTSLAALADGDNLTIGKSLVKARAAIVNMAIGLLAPNLAYCCLRQVVLYSQRNPWFLAAVDFHGLLVSKCRPSTRPSSAFVVHIAHVGCCCSEKKMRGLYA